MQFEVDLASAVMVAGVIFWLVGGNKWLEEKTRQLKLKNDREELEINKTKES